MIKTHLLFEYILFFLSFEFVQFFSFWSISSIVHQNFNLIQFWTLFWVNDVFNLFNFNSILYFLKLKLWPLSRLFEFIQKAQSFHQRFNIVIFLIDSFCLEYVQMFNLFHLFSIHSNLNFTLLPWWSGISRHIWINFVFQNMDLQFSRDFIVTHMKIFTWRIDRWRHIWIRR